MNPALDRVVSLGPCRTDGLGDGVIGDVVKHTKFATHRGDEAGPLGVVRVVEFQHNGNMGLHSHGGVGVDEGCRHGVGDLGVGGTGGTRDDMAAWNGGGSGHKRLCGGGGKGAAENVGS